jgi:hypothetical protein
MPFTNEEKAELQSMIQEVLDKTRERRMEQAALSHQAELKSQTTKLYLISFSGHHIAFPDERARAIFNQCVYAFVTMKGEDPHFFGGKIVVIAYGDGKKLKEPVSVILTGGSIIAMVEASEALLES